MSRVPMVLVVFCLLAAVALPGQVQAQAMDVPTVSVVRVSEHSIVLRLGAGASGAPEGIAIEWMEGFWYNFGGGWSNTTYLVWCDFNGVPTLNTYGGDNYQLAAGSTVDVEVGDLFDETGYLANYDGELDPGTEYVFRAKTLGDGVSPESAWTSELFVLTEEENEEECTFTQGYWKNHEEAWPVASLTLGSVVYTKAQLLDIFNTPAEGNGLIFLAHQLIAAKLNVAADAVPTAAVQNAIDDADTLIGALVVPPVGGGYLLPADASGLTEYIDQFNNGTLPGNCGVTPVEPSSWGRVKATFGN